MQCVLSVAFSNSGICSWKFSLNIFNFSLVSVIEHLPSELGDQFTTIREMDLSVQSKFPPKCLEKKLCWQVFTIQIGSGACANITGKM